jgi:glucokinase
MEKYTIGLDVGGTSSKYGVVDLAGKILEQGSLETCRTSDVQDFVERLADVLNPLIEKFGGAKNFKGMGVGAPNGNHYTGNIELAPNLKWVGIVPLAKLLEQKFSMRTTLTNDANAAAMGEMIYGAAKGMKDFMVITLGTGLGSGIVVDGKVLLGVSGMAGEVGQVIVEKNGRLCGCGRQGCLETYASATGIVKTVKEKLQTEKSSLTGQDITSASISQAAQAGDKVALEAFAFTGEILGLALANAVAFSSPEAIFLFGGLARSGDLLMKPTQEAFDKYLHNIFQGTVRLLPSALPDSDAAILGASALV